METLASGNIHSRYVNSLRESYLNNVVHQLGGEGITISKEEKREVHKTD